MQVSGYEVPVFVTMLRSSNGENHDNELRLKRGWQFDDFWLAHQCQGDACVVDWFMFRLPRHHVCLFGGGLEMPSEHLGDEVLGAYCALVQPFFVAPNFAQGENVKILLIDAFGYHAVQDAEIFTEEHNGDLYTQENNADINNQSILGLGSSSSSSSSSS